MALLRRISNLFRRSRLDNDIDAELQSHIDLRIDDSIARGKSPEEARRDALLRFGNRASTRERVTAADTPLSLENFTRDLRYALRQLRRSPGFALTAILTLALGIGANVVVFGLLNSILLRPLNVADADRLLEIVGRNHGDDNQSYPDYLDFRARNTAFTDIAAYRSTMAGMSNGGSAQRMWAFETSGNYFDMLGIQPQLGRFYHASDEHGPDSAPYIVLSDSLWRSRFNADPRVIGMSVDLNKHPFTIIGVAPKGFNGTEIFFWPDFWMPLVNQGPVEGFTQLPHRNAHGLWVIGSLKPGVTVARATDNLNAVAHQMTRENPQWDDGLSARLVKPGLIGDILSGPTHAFLAAIMLLALMVLSAACANLAGIFAARSADRARELAIRLSIGSTRWRILRQLLTEAVLISLAGGIAGTIVAAALLGAISRWRPIPELPIHVTVVPDARVYLIALLLSFASGILPGLLPARQIWRTDAMQAMKSGAASAAVLRRLTLRDILLGVQITLCALLVTASLVALRGMERSLHAPTGFLPQSVVLAQAELQMAGYSNQDAFPVQRRMIDEASRIPGVIAAGTTSRAPLSGGDNNSDVYREDTTDLRTSNSVASAHSFVISPGYLNAAGTRLLSGRDFTWDDDATAPKVAVINHTLARRLFGSDSAVGRKFRDTGKTLYQVVGVVEDGKYRSLTEDPSAAMFFPLSQTNSSATTLVVRSQLPTADTSSALHRVLTGIDSTLPFVISTWPDALGLVLFPARAATIALGIMGFLAAMLAVTGVFGMAAYTVSRRLRELGIRVALGAHRTQLMHAALGRPLLVLLSGSAAGLVLGVLASRLLAYLVYQATPRDPLVLAGAVLAMTAIGLIATWIPARRALAVDPARLLRED
jgi:predicted permease